MIADCRGGPDFRLELGKFFNQDTRPRQLMRKGDA